MNTIVLNRNSIKFEVFMVTRNEHFTPEMEKFQPKVNFTTENDMTSTELAIFGWKTYHFR